MSLLKARELLPVQRIRLPQLSAHPLKCCTIFHILKFAVPAHRTKRHVLWMISLLLMLQLALLLLAAFSTHVQMFSRRSIGSSGQNTGGQRTMLQEKKSIALASRCNWMQSRGGIIRDIRLLNNGENCAQFCRTCPTAISISTIFAVFLGISVTLSQSK